MTQISNRSGRFSYEIVEGSNFKSIYLDDIKRTTMSEFFTRKSNKPLPS